jgi:hypothetical protein
MRDHLAEATNADKAALDEARVSLREGGYLNSTVIGLKFQQWNNSASKKNITFISPETTRTVVENAKPFMDSREPDTLLMNEVLNGQNRDIYFAVTDGSLHWAGMFFRQPKPNNSSGYFEYYDPSSKEVLPEAVALHSHLQTISAIPGFAGAPMRRRSMPTDKRRYDCGRFVLAVGEMGREHNGSFGNINNNNADFHSILANSCSRNALRSDTDQAFIASKTGESNRTGFIQHLSSPASGSSQNATATRRFDGYNARGAAEAGPSNYVQNLESDAAMARRLAKEERATRNYVRANRSHLVGAATSSPFELRTERGPMNPLLPRQTTGERPSTRTQLKTLYTALKHPKDTFNALKKEFRDHFRRR